MDALDEVLPGVAAQCPRVRLGDWPTPIEPLRCVDRDAVYVKREDQSSRIYGGNKIRCLETVFGRAQRRGHRRVWGLGAWGSNQALAIALHGPRAGFETGALLFPQPASAAAAQNLVATAGAVGDLRLQRSLLQFPWAYWQVWRTRAANGDLLIPPGAATPLGALGHLSAAFEVALAVEAGEIPPPRHLVVPVGSTCTTAGLLLGLAAAHRLGLGFDVMPTVHAVRVTPWPITAAFRIRRLSQGAAHLLATLGGPDMTAELAWLGSLRVLAGHLGWGYGRPTKGGYQAIGRFVDGGGPTLDTTYSAKGAAGLLDLLPGVDGPILFWSTKSAAPLPEPGPGVVDRLPPSVRRWLGRGGVDVSVLSTGGPVHPR
jgi:D-cysteine desulfhydrase